MDSKTKRCALAFLAVGAAMLLGCGKSAKENISKDTIAATPQVPSEKGEVVVTVEDGRMTYGDHQYTADGNIGDGYDTKAQATVTFTNVPSDYTEFERVYKELLGKTPYGTAAMLPMAMEMYGRDAAVGEKCFELLCTPTCASEALRELKQKYVPSEHAQKGDPYVQRFIAAAVLEGATPENGYAPSEPYTVRMTAHSQASSYQESQIAQGDVKGLYILGGGWPSTPQRAVQIIKLWNGDGYYKVFSFPALYTMAAPIRGMWGGLK